VFAALSEGPSVTSATVGCPDCNQVSRHIARMGERKKL